MNCVLAKYKLVDNHKHTMENDAIRRMLIMELMDDELNFNPIAAAIDNFIEPVNIVGPERVEPVRNEDYYDQIIPYYTLDDFHNHFRMSRATIEVNILNKLINFY